MKGHLSLIETQSYNPYRSTSASIIVPPPPPIEDGDNDSGEDDIRHRHYRSRSSQPGRSTSSGSSKQPRHHQSSYFNQPNHCPLCVTSSVKIVPFACGHEYCAFCIKRMIRYDTPFCTICHETDMDPDFAKYLPNVRKESMWGGYAEQISASPQLTAKLRKEAAVVEDRKHEEILKHQKHVDTSIKNFLAPKENFDIAADDQSSGGDHRAESKQKPSSDGHRKTGRERQQQQTEFNKPTKPKSKKAKSLLCLC